MVARILKSFNALKHCIVKCLVSWKVKVIIYCFVKKINVLFRKKNSLHFHLDLFH